jgi:ADP-heptose:LPS heptosyltransferase
MPYSYSHKKETFSKVVELLSFVVLAPLNAFRSPSALSNPASFLIVEPFQMGDLISTTVLLDPLKRRFPDAKIYLLTKPGNAGVLLSDPRIEKILSADFPWSDYGIKRGSIKRWWGLAKALFGLRKYKFEAGIDCRGDVRSQLIMAIAGCRNRIGYTNYLNSNLNVRGLLLTHRVPRPPYKHRFDWNAYILTALGLREQDLIPIAFPTLKLPRTPQISQYPASPYMLIHVGGGWQYKRWPVGHWIALVDRLTEKYKYPIKLIAGPAEKDLLNQITAAISRQDYVSMILPSLAELVELISGCSLFLGLDSGPMNIAVALNKKVVALFGPGDSDTWYPYQDGSVFIHKKERFPCNPCAQIKCYYPEKNCMASISAEEVEQMVSGLLAKAAGRVAN